MRGRPLFLRAALGLAALLGENRFLPFFLHSDHPPTYRFVVYKLPAHTGSGDATQNGLRYKYFDEDSEDWRDGVGFINSTTGAVGRSLLPLYRNNNSQVMTPPAQPGVGLEGGLDLREPSRCPCPSSPARLCALQ